jgi:NlpC/P60 family putative phage cell wall peptidase
MPRRNEIVAEARRWLGCPYHHQGRAMGHGVDCYGVIEMVGRALGVSIPENINYSRVPDEAELIGYMDEYAVRIPVNEAKEGDILIIPFLKRMRHMAIKTDIGILHAYEPLGKVVEHALDGGWSRMVRRAYQYPGVTD